MNDQEYRAYPALNWSRLKKILKSPLEFKEDIPLDSKAAELGTLLHAVLLEGFDKYINFDALKAKHLEGVKDSKGNIAKSPAATTEGKKIVAQLAAQYSEYKFCTEEEIAMIEFYKREFETNFAIKQIMDDSRRETVHFRTLFDREVKCKADIITKRNVIWDLKTTNDLEPRAFSRKAFSLDYHAQICFYAHVAQAVPGGIIAISTKAPYQVSIIDLSEDTIEHAKKRIEKAMLLLDECERHDSFPGYGNFSLELPKYLENETVEEEGVF